MGLYQYCLSIMFKLHFIKAPIDFYETPYQLRVNFTM